MHHNVVFSLSLGYKCGVYFLLGLWGDAARNAGFLFRLWLVYWYARQFLTKSKMVFDVLVIGYFFECQAKDVSELVFVLYVHVAAHVGGLVL